MDEQQRQTERELLTGLVDSAWPLLGAPRLWIDTGADGPAALVRVDGAVWKEFLAALSTAWVWRTSADGADHVYAVERAGEETLEEVLATVVGEDAETAPVTAETEGAAGQTGVAAKVRGFVRRFRGE